MKSSSGRTAMAPKGVILCIGTALCVIACDARDLTGQDHRMAVAAADELVTAQFLAERGMLVEFLGLQNWTADMVRDSLAVHAPRQSFVSGLATALRERLGFPEAAAWALTDGDSAAHVVVALIEPQDSILVRRREIGPDTLANSTWSSLLVDLARTRLDLLSGALEPIVYARAVGLPPFLPAALRQDSIAVHEIWAEIEGRRTAPDMAEASRLLTASPDPYDRLAAVALLSAFSDNDTAWHSLVGAILDPDERVRQLAYRVLIAFRDHGRRQVDWRPAAKELHAILNGSALFAVRGVLDVLVATKVGPDLAGALLGNGGQAVLMFAGASHPGIRRSSHRFLRIMSGQDLRSPAAWTAWIAELQP